MNMGNLLFLPYTILKKSCCLNELNERFSSFKYLILFYWCITNLNKFKYVLIHIHIFDLNKISSFIAFGCLTYLMLTLTSSTSVLKWPQSKSIEVITAAKRFSYFTLSLKVLWRVNDLLSLSFPKVSGFEKDLKCFYYNKKFW